MRWFWPQIHWLLGITAGVVLAVVGVTGGLLSFEDDLLRWINSGVMTVESPGSAALPMDELVARVRATQPEKRLVSLTVSADPREAARAGFVAKRANQQTESPQARSQQARSPEAETRPASAPAPRPRTEFVYVDPYTATLLGTPRGQGFFRTVTDLHRRLVSGDVGKQIVGASTVGLLILALSGLYLRWPRRLTDWRAWLKIDVAHKGRSFLWHLHAVVGTWVLLFYLLTGFTGLYWSYDWYRNGLQALSGAPRASREAPTLDAPVRGEPDVARIWDTFVRESGGYRNVTLTFPQKPDQAVDIRYLDADPAHDRAASRMAVHPVTGEMIRHDPYDARPLGARLIGSMLSLHSGSYFGLVGIILVMLASLCMPLFAITGWQMYLDRRGKQRAARAAAVTSAAGESDGALLVAFASQTGVAEQLAWKTAGSLQAAGVPVSVQPLGKLDPQGLGQYRGALFIVSTFGDGDAPDSARGFARRVMKHSAPLSGLRYGLLSLGDRHFRDTFCGFGRSLDAWLRRQGAQLMFTPVEMDGGDSQALHNWRERLSELGAKDISSWEDSAYGDWRLVERRCLNPGSVGAPTYHLEFEARNGMPTWQAGDIAELRLPSPATAAPREYSIASLSQDGRLHLLVRRMQRDDGTPGLASGWLTANAAPGASVGLRIRVNTGFHASAQDRPMILIGNGTGLAGLRAHLKARAHAGRGNNWLIFGERQAAHDYYYRDEIEAWQRDGVLARVDLAFSRDQPERVYVQQRVRDAADAVRAWVNDGAAIYVCGSIEGMAPGVEAALIDILGLEPFEELVADGRYRRDVY